MLNILLVSEYFPYPPDNGAKIRIWYFLQALSQVHRVTLLAFLRKSDQRFIGEVSKYCQLIACPLPAEIPLWKKLTNAFSATPLGVWRRKSLYVEEMIRRVLCSQSIQLMMIEEVWMAQYALRVPISIYKVIDKLNIEFVRSWRRLRTISAQAFPINWGLRLLYGAIALRLQRYEINTLSHFGKVIVCSEKDAHTLKSMRPGLNVEIIPNGVDINYFFQRPEKEDENIIVYTGAFAYEPNVDAVIYFAKEVMPIIRKEISDVRFIVVGSDPPKKILSLKNFDASIVITGYVDDIRPFVGDAKVFVAPLRMGSGTRLKILQAMAMGKPVVTTTVGCEGLTVENGTHLLIADSPLEFAKLIIELLKNKELRQKIGAQARQLVCEEYAWPKIQATLLRVFDRIEEKVKWEYH